MKTQAGSIQNDPGHIYMTKNNVEIKINITSNISALRLVEVIEELESLGWSLGQSKKPDCTITSYLSDPS